LAVCSAASSARKRANEAWIATHFLFRSENTDSSVSINKVISLTDVGKSRRLEQLTLLCANVEWVCMGVR
jgi:hypothetical protein